MVCAAPYGGPMAIVRDPKKITKITGSSKPVVRIFTASGILLGTIAVRHCLTSMGLLFLRFLFLLFTVEQRSFADYGMVGQRRTDMCAGRWIGVHL